MPHEMGRVDAQAKHEQKALCRELGKMCQLADGMLRQRAEMYLAQKLVDAQHHSLTAGGGDCRGLQ